MGKNKTKCDLTIKDHLQAIKDYCLKMYDLGKCDECVIKSLCNEFFYDYIYDSQKDLDPYDWDLSEIED